MARQRDTLSSIRHAPDRKVLRHLHLHTLHDVWRTIGKDLDGLDPIVQAGADRSHLIHDLMASAVCDADEKGVSWPRRHFLDLALAAAALGLAALRVSGPPRRPRSGWRPCWSGLSRGPPRWGSPCATCGLASG